MPASPVQFAQMGMEDPSSHSQYRARALGRQAQSQQRDRGEVEDVSSQWTQVVH